MNTVTTVLGDLTVPVSPVLLSLSSDLSSDLSDSDVVCWELPSDNCHTGMSVDMLSDTKMSTDKMSTPRLI